MSENIHIYLYIYIIYQIYSYIYTSRWDVRSYDKTTCHSGGRSKYSLRVLLIRIGPLSPSLTLWESLFSNWLFDGITSLAYHCIRLFSMGVFFRSQPLSGCIRERRLIMAVWTQRYGNQLRKSLRMRRGVLTVFVCVCFCFMRFFTLSPDSSPTTQA